MYTTSTRTADILALFLQVPGYVQGVAVSPTITKFATGAMGGASTGTPHPTDLIELRVLETDLTPEGLASIVEAKGWTNITIHDVIEPTAKHPAGKTFVLVTLQAS